MTELLAPAGNMEALRAAVSNGCDAVYLGLEKFGARAYSDNFTIDSLAEAIRYAHLRDVKIYVTMNTIVFEDEICDMRQQLDALNGIGVDGIIVQDLAVFDYVAANFADMEVHCSTQMGVDDLEGTMPVSYTHLSKRKRMSIDRFSSDFFRDLRLSERGCHARCYGSYQ